MRVPSMPAPSPVNPDSGLRLLSPKEAAPLLLTTPGNLAQWRHQRRGPAHIKLGGIVGYRLSDIDSYLMANLVVPES